MEENTKYWDKSWNTLIGCEKISIGCIHCPALAYLSKYKTKLGEPYCDVMNMFGIGWRDEWNRQIRFISSKLDVPVRTKTPTVFAVCQLGDLFQQNTLFSWIDQVFDIMDSTPHHQFLVLTKRVNYMSRYLMVRYGTKKVPDHIWIGASVEADRYIGRINDLMTINANLWLSLEQLRSDINIYEYLEKGHIKCVVVGRAINSNQLMIDSWISDIQLDCEQQNTPFFNTGNKGKQELPWMNQKLVQTH